MSHKEYIAYQHLYRMTESEREEVDSIVTALMNLHYTAPNARRSALCLYRDIPEFSKP